MKDLADAPSCPRGEEERQSEAGLSLSFPHCARLPDTPLVGGRGEAGAVLVPLSPR